MTAMLSVAKHLCQAGKTDRWSENLAANPKVTIYTDGACIGNPGPGGYGVVLLYNGHRKELSGGYRETTNNRMETLAAIVGLEALEEVCQVTVYSDSAILVKGIEEGWAKRWRANGWWRNKKDKALNTDLWSRLLGLCEQHEVKFAWVRGHAGNPENERCDQLAVQAAHSPNLMIDKGYKGSATLLA